FGRDAATVLADEEIFHPGKRAGREVDFIGTAAALHARGEIHRLSPDIECQLADANDAADHRSGVQADAYRPARLAGHLAIFYLREDLVCSQHGIHGVRGHVRGQTGDAHVAVADG